MIYGCVSQSEFDMHIITRVASLQPCSLTDRASTRATGYHFTTQWAHCKATTACLLTYVGSTRSCSCSLQVGWLGEVAGNAVQSIKGFYERVMASHSVGERKENTEGRSFVIIVTSRGGTLAGRDNKLTDDKLRQTVATSVFRVVFAALSSPGNTSIVCLFSLFV